MAPAMHSFATPVSGSLESQNIRDSTHPYHQVHRTSRRPAALFPPSPAPNFSGFDNVFSEGGGNQFAANVHPAFQTAVPLSNYRQFPAAQQQRQFPTMQQQFPSRQFPGTQPPFASNRRPRDRHISPWGHAPEQTLQQFSTTYPSSTTLANKQIGTLSNVAPNPVASLAWRLRPKPKRVQDEQEQKCSMKTVDAVVKDWTKPFSGETSEHWMEHINKLERKFAIKHKLLFSTGYKM